MRRVFLVVAVAVAVPAVASAAPAPVTWCGTDEVTANRVPDLEVSAVEQVRFVYAIPSDGVDRFQQLASGIATDAAWIDQWWQAQDPTRTPRFDRYPFPNCTSKFGGLDIGFVRLPNATAYYELDNTPSLRLDRDLQAMFPSTEKTIVYFDSLTQDTHVCGETDYLSDREGGGQGIVYVYPQSDCGLSPIGSGASAEVAAHELIHNLGAVPSGAPHECPDSLGHVCDSTLDIMYPYLSGGSTLDRERLDVGRDDYYGHSGSQWDVQDSSWLAHLPQFPVSLAVGGAGRLVVKSGSSLLACTNGCTDLSLDNGTTVSVTAVPATGAKFARWSGGCSGAAPRCTFAVGAATTATATFVTAPRLKLTVAVEGRGRVTSTPAGIACAAACSKSFPAGAVRLTARPRAGWRFAGWSGACAGTAGCTVTASGTARARFARR